MRLNISLLKVFFYSLLVGSFFITSCAFNIFNSVGSVDSEAGKDGDINNWYQQAVYYYQGESEDGAKHAKTITRNLIDYRWDEMNVNMKFNITLLYSSIIANDNIVISKKDFLDKVAILAGSFNTETLALSNNDTSFINNHLNYAYDMRYSALPALEKLVPYSNQISSIESITIFIHIGSAFVISYADHQNNQQTPDSMTKVAQLSAAQFIFLNTYTNETDTTSLHYVFNNSNRQDFTNYFTNDYCGLSGDPIIEDTSFYGQLKIVENELGTTYLNRFYNYIDEIALPEIDLSLSLKNTNEAEFQSTFDPIVIMQENFQSFINRKNQTDSIKNDCATTNVRYNSNIF